MLLKLKVKPNSETQKISVCKDEGGLYLKVWLKSPPKGGRANKELFKLLREVFGDFEFVSGLTSREKLIKIKNIDKLKNLENSS